MTKKRDDERYSNIIDGYLNSARDKDTENRIKKVFAFWFFNDKDRTTKDDIIDELLATTTAKDYDLSDREVENIAEKIISQSRGIKRTKSLSFMRIATRVAAVIVPLVVIAGAWIYFGGKDTNNTFVAQYEVPYGNVEEQTLGDSTRVTINAGTKLIVSQSETERVAELTGESYFMVEKDAARPFIVKTKDLTITVLGTEFNVEAYPDRDVTIVTLDKGKIAINTTQDQHFTLEPNQQFVYTRSTMEGAVRTLEQAKSEEASEWKNGMIVFDKITLREALKIVERSYNVEIIVTSNTNMDEILMSKYEKNMGVEELMSLIKAISPDFSYEIKNRE